MRLTSADFSHDGRMPAFCACEGQSLSPALAWADAPARTLSFLVLCEDPDAPDGARRHWAAYDIPHGWSHLDRGAGRAAARRHIKQAVNDFGKAGYGGSSPHERDRPHPLRFTLLALSIDRLPVDAGARCEDVEREARRHVLAEATLVGICEPA